MDWVHGGQPYRKNDGYYHHAAPVHLEHEGTICHAAESTAQALQLQYRLRPNAQWAPPSEIGRTIPAVQEYAHAGPSYCYTNSHHRLV